MALPPSAPSPCGDDPNPADELAKAMTDFCHRWMESALGIPVFLRLFSECEGEPDVAVDIPTPRSLDSKHEDRELALVVAEWMAQKGPAVALLSSPLGSGKTIATWQHPAPRPTADHKSR